MSAEAADAAPRSYQRLLFEGLRQALAMNDSARASDRVAEAALTGLPWLLSSYCSAIKIYRATLAAGTPEPLALSSPSVAEELQFCI